MNGTHTPLPPKTNKQTNKQTKKKKNKQKKRTVCDECRAKAAGGVHGRASEWNACARAITRQQKKQAHTHKHATHTKTNVRHVGTKTTIRTLEATLANTHTDTRTRARTHAPMK